MTIIWCGGEDIDFPYKNCAISTDSGKKRSVSRCSFQLSVDGDYAKSVLITPFSSVWASCYIYSQMSFATGTVYRSFGLQNSSSGAFIGIGTSSTAGKVYLVTYNRTTMTALASESGVSLPSGTLAKIDIQITGYDAGASGNCKVYVNGTLIIDYNGELSVLSETELNQVYMRCSDNTYSTAYISEIILADEDTRLMSLKTIAPDSAGDSSAWEGAYTDIDDVTLSDTDTIYSDTADEVALFNTTGMPAGDFSVKAVKVAARCADGIGSMGIQIGVKTNSTVDLGTTEEIEPTWETVEKLYQVNPITSAPFTPAEIDALQLAFKSVAII